MEFEENEIQLKDLKIGDFFIGRLEEISVYLGNIKDDEHSIYSISNKNIYNVPHGRFPSFKSKKQDFEIINIETPNFKINEIEYFVETKMFSNLFEFQKLIYDRIVDGYNKCYLFSIDYKNGLFFIRYKFLG